MVILEYNLKRVPKGMDYLFEDYEEFMKVFPYLKYGRVDGFKWKISFIDVTIEEARILAEFGFPDCVEASMYLKKDILRRLLQENVQLKEEKLSNYDKYKLMIQEFPLLFENKAMSELYRRASGNLENIASLLNELKMLYYDVGIIRVSHINTVIIREDRVYARDVILSLLLSNNTKVPRKGHVLSQYCYKNWRKLYDELYKELGEEIAFYALRKSVKKLYENKIKYLKNETIIKDVEIVKFVDVCELMFAHMYFQNGNKKQTEAILRIIEGRRSDVSLFEGTFLSDSD